MNNVNTIFGAPGCGKTTYLINLLEDILSRYDPNRVAFVSFTKKGSYEGRDRALRAFNYKEKDLPYFRTIHSLAFRDMGITKYDMIGFREYKEFSKAMGMNFLGYYTEDLMNNDDKYLSYASLLKNNLKTAKEMEWDLDMRKARHVIHNFARYCKEVGKKTFDDLIVEFIKSNKPLPVKVAIIDEAQDLTTLQWEFCRVAFKNCEEVYIAGDDDQAVYEWSGADVHQFLSIAKASKMKVLDKSYRLRSLILHYSKGISEKIKTRIPKEFQAVSDGGEILTYSDVREVTVNSEESYYFLARNNLFLPVYKEALKGMGIVFMHKEKSSVDLLKYEAIKIYEHYRKHDPQKAGKDIKVAPFLRKDRKPGDVWYDAFEFSAEESKYYRDLFKNKTNVEVCTSTVSTIHGVKGGEADNVVVYLGVTKRVHQNFTQSRDTLDAELRCLYVALTRAKKRLHIVMPDTKFGYDELLRGGL